MPFSGFVEIARKDVVFDEIEFLVFRHDDVESSVVVDDDRTEGFDRGFESFRYFPRSKRSVFAPFFRYPDDVFRKPLAFVHSYDFYAFVQGFRPKYPYFVIESAQEFEGGIGFLSSFVKLRNGYQEIVRILGFADVEGKNPLSSRIAVDFQDDVPPDPAVAF